MICGTKMPKNKNMQVVVNFFPKFEPHEVPSNSCKNFIIEFIAKFYEENTL